MGFLGKKKEEYLYRNLLGKSHHIIVPHLEVGAELVELFNIPEKNISVIPYFIPEKNTEKPFSALQAYGIHP